MTTSGDSRSQSERPSGEVAANIEMTILSRRISLQLTVSDGPIRARELLPMAHGLTQIASDIACAESDASGKPVSCKAGCGACCRQLIPISQTEAHHLRAVVGAMPDARRMDIERRFDEALSQLQQADMLAPLRSAEHWSKLNPVEFGATYFRLGIPCPFLEDESCSIHEVRPMTCRAFSVTSPAQNCSDPRPDTIVPVQHPLPRPLDAFGRAIAGAAEGTPVPWVPLVLALDYARNVPEPPPEYSGPSLLRAVFDAMTGTEVSGAPSA